MYFLFEKDFMEKGITCIPMIIRYKLDRVGIKLSLRHWSLLSEERRNSLFHFPIHTTLDLLAFEKELIYFLNQKASDIQKIEPVHSFTNQFSYTYQVLAARFEIPAQHWNELSTLQKFALSKLIRPSHESKNLVPALMEFGMIPAYAESVY